MEKKPKKQLTATQRKNRYRALQYSFVGGEFLSILAPFVVMGIANADEWFVKNEEGGWKVGIGFSLAMALLGIATWLATKKKDKESEITNGWIALVVGWFAVAFVFVLLGSIIDQISTIMLWGGIGIIGAAGLDIASKQMKRRADAYKEALGEAEKDLVKEEAMRQVKAERSEPTE